MTLTQFTALNWAECAPFPTWETDRAREALEAMAKVTANDEILETAVFLREHDDAMISERDITGMVNDCAELFLKEQSQ